jgi:hypothetical protein
MNFGSEMMKYLAVVLALMMISACAATPQSREDEIRLRAQARWDALLEGDYVTAHSYLSPGYRSTISAVDFEIEIRSRRVRYQSAEYQSQSCNENTCTVTMSIGFKVMEPVRGLPEWDSTSSVAEQWVRTDGEWWYLPK